jgi:N-acetylneuraminate lyase
MNNSREHWNGLYPACFTPLNDDETLDEQAFAAFARSLFQLGMKGLYVAGTTGEGYALEDSVRAKTFKVAVSAKLDGSRIIAHAGAVPTKRAVALAKQAADCGCDAVAAMPPFGPKYTFDEIFSFFQTISAAIPVPLFVYHIPMLSGYDLTREQLSRCMELPNVIGAKFSGHDLFKLERMAALHPDKMFFSGADEMLMHGLACGTAGAVGASYSLTAPIALKIFNAVKRGDAATARKAQSALNGFIEVLQANGGVRTMKLVAAKRNNWRSARSPRPSGAPPEAQAEKIERALNEALAAASTLP